MNRTLLFFGYYLVLIFPYLVNAQSIDTLQSRPGVSFRGLSIVNNRFFWVSGSKGTVGRSTDAGNTIAWLTVQGHEKRDFRDIEAFDAVTAVIMAVDSPGLILRTHDAGASWQEVYQDNRSGIFLDAMDFWRDRDGMTIGDPIDGKTILIQTRDAGKSWSPVPEAALPVPDTGEACFASSGTNIQLLSKTKFAFVTGGQSARYFNGRSFISLPLVQHGNSTGANSLAIRGGLKKKSRRHQYVVGGDFTKDTVRIGNAAYTNNGGRTWILPKEPPYGYRSSVVYITRHKMVTCGTSGVDVSEDGGRHWRNISKTGYHVCKVAKDGKSVYLAGGNGRMAKLIW